MPGPIPEAAKGLIVRDAADVQGIARDVDFVFCAVDMKKEEIRALEEAYARAECPVVSNNSAHRFTPDVPMVVPEVNAGHIEVIPFQRRRLGTKRGFIAVKSNCSLQSYVPALHPLMEPFGVEKCLVCTYQAISGAGKTFATWPEMVDNCIPYIGRRRRKKRAGPLKLWGHIENGVIVPAGVPSITAQCFRVACSDGHMAAVFASFRRKPSDEDIKRAWVEFSGPAQELGLPVHQNSLSTILNRRTALKRSWTAGQKTAWPSAWAACVLIRSTTISLCAFRTIRCAAQPAALCFWQSFWPQRAILPECFVSRRFAESGGYFETACLPGLRHSACDAPCTRTDV